MSNFADIHCHPSLHPVAYKLSGKKRNNNLWDYDPPRPNQRNSKFPEFSQCDFTTLAKAGVKLIYTSLYPLEQGWFNAKYIKEGLFTDWAAKLIARVPVKYINMVQRNDLNYYKYLQDEYNFFKADHDKLYNVDGEQWKFKLIKNGNDIDQIMSEERTIGVIVTIEGIHSLVSGNETSINSALFDYQQTIKNVEAIKNWDFPPFFITMAHHFYNGYCGHTRSLPKTPSALLDQTIGLNDPINEKGEEIIDCLLGINKFEGNGRRILIDTKHMSVSSRLQYYAKVKSFNAEHGEDNKIPIITSHSAYSGYSTMSSSIIRPDTDNTKYASSEAFNNWSINISDEEIITIFKSRGIIGINFDERILSGADILEDYDEQFKVRDIKRNDARIKEFWGEQILSNVLAIVKAVYDSDEIEKSEKAQIWNMIALGTDFDGMINPVDAFITAEDFVSVEEIFTKLLPKQKNINELRMGIDIQQIIRKIMFDNALEFAKLHFR